MKPVTIKDIASALGIAPSTVSRALRNSHEISSATQERVTAYANKVNFKLNKMATGLRNGRSYSIGVIVADVANSFFSQAISGIESVAHEDDYHVIITQSHDSVEREKANLNHLVKQSIDGLIVSVASDTSDYSHFTAMQNRGLPIIYFDRVPLEIESFKISTNNFKAAYDATSLMISKGYRRIAHLSTMPNLSISSERLAGYRKAIQFHGLTFDESLVRYSLSGGRDETEIYEIIKSLLDPVASIDAMFMGNDQLSTVCIKILKNYYPNKNLCLLGFSNAETIELLSPQISYIRQQSFEMGKLAARMLLDQLHRREVNESPVSVKLDAEIIWNSSNSSASKI